MARTVTYRDIVREIALDNYGFVTTRAAVEAGVPATELPKISSRGGLESIAYGLYRVTEVPLSEYDRFAEALFRVGEGSYLYGETVLALFGLADVNPRTVKVAVARRARPKLPDFIQLVRVREGERTTHYEGLAAQTVADAILACRGRIETRRLRETTAESRAEGLLTLSEWRCTMKELGEPLDIDEDRGPAISDGLSDDQFLLFERVVRRIGWSAALAWFSQPNSHLGGAAPVNLLSNPEGRGRLSAHILSLEDGNYL